MAMLIKPALPAAGVRLVHCRTPAAGRQAAPSRRIGIKAMQTTAASAPPSTAQGEPVATNKIFTSAMKVTKVDTVEPGDWRPAAVISVKDVAEGVRCITVDAECSREFVPMDNAYLRPGQLAQVRLPGRESVLKVCISSPPFPSEANYAVTIKSRGDIPAGTTKLPQYFISVKCPLDLHVLKSENPELFGMKQGDEVEVGPFDKSTGLDLRPVLFLSRFPSMLFFASGKGIAAARSIIGAKEGEDSSLNLKLRRDVRLYYSAPSPSLIAYKDDFGGWEKTKGVKVRTIVKTAAPDHGWKGHLGSFQDLWDEDDVEYDPRSTAVVLCAEKDTEAELERLVDEAEFARDQLIKWII